MSEAEEKPLKRGKWWCVGVTPDGWYVPYIERTSDAPNRRFKLNSKCQNACDKLNNNQNQKP